MRKGVILANGDLHYWNVKKLFDGLVNENDTLILWVDSGIPNDKVVTYCLNNKVKLELFHSGFNYATDPFKYANQLNDFKGKCNEIHLLFHFFYGKKLNLIKDYFDANNIKHKDFDVGYDEFDYS